MRVRVKLGLGVEGNVQLLLGMVQKPVLEPEKGMPERWRLRKRCPVVDQPGQFQLELDALAVAVVEVKKRRLLARVVSELLNGEGEIELALAVPRVPGSSVRSGGPPWARSTARTAAVILLAASRSFEVVELRHGVGLGPEAHIALGVGLVLVVDLELAVQVGLNLRCLSDDPHRMPFSEFGSIDLGAGELIASAVLHRIETEVVLD